MIWFVVFCVGCWEKVLKEEMFSLIYMTMSEDSLKNKVSQICQDQGVKRLELFGSRARSPVLEGRDYDFVATFEELPPDEYSKRFFKLLHGLEESLGGPVDLLTPQSIAKKSLRDKIEKEKICVYES